MNTASGMGFASLTRARRVGSVLGVALMALLGSFGANRAQAFEAIDGRFEAHGYFEMQLRTMSRNYGDQWDLTQWYNVFNLELELDLVQDTHGILDLLEAYVRIEARYDCIYTRGCGMLQGVDVYGNESRRLPERLMSGNEYTHAGTIFISDDGSLTDSQRDPYTIKTVPGFRGIYEGTPEGLGRLDYAQLMRCGNNVVGTGGDAYCPETEAEFLPGRIAARFWNADRNRRAEGAGGLPGAQPAADDGTEGAPYLIAMEPFKDFKFASIPQIGGSGNGFPLLVMGPWLPQNFVAMNATLAGLPNPLDQSRTSPQSLGSGFGANPMRPIPIFREDNAGSREIYVYQETELGSPGAVDAGRWQAINPVTGRFGDQREWNDRAALDSEARGLFVPTPPLREALARGDFGYYPFNISEMDRAFNRGASQQDEGELKEAYLDIEMFDSRLWLRVGKQSIVWGKTELFRTTDQFNPQDLALATLPSLEESRIALWSMRGVWSFYEVGPLSDVRIEVAMNFDEFESADLGSCGEPYAVNVICALTFGSWAHGFTGLGVAGIQRPPDPWEDAGGIEFGVRIEWRWDRFSFAITDFYGYDDFPHTVRLSTYNRNVDWRSGRPRHYMQTPEQMADVSAFGCATPVGRGVVIPETGGGAPNFTQYPTEAGARIEYGGSANAGCLTPGASNRMVGYENDQALIAQLDGIADPEDVEEFSEWGVPYRVSTELRQAQITPVGNSLKDVAGRWLNNSALSDPNDPRRVYSRAVVASGGTPTSVSQWPDGPQAHLCESDTRLAGHPDCAVSARGKRVFETMKFVEYNGELLPNPAYNPYYDPRFDRHFDVGAYDVAALNAGLAGAQFDLQADPGLVIASTPVLFDPFRALSDNARYVDQFGHMWWGNAYDPVFDEYDPRNSLDSNPVNVSLFNFICAVTVGFSDLDPSACALTVFSSSKRPSGGDGGSPRISTLIGTFMAGNGGFNGFLGEVPSDDILSTGPLLPGGMGMPLVRLHDDLGAADLGFTNTGAAGSTLCNAIEFGCGRDAFRTTDVRRHWAYAASALPSLTQDPENTAYPWIYARESESYNCFGASPARNSFNGLHLCGGLEIGDIDPLKLNGNLKPEEIRGAYNVGQSLGRALTPEQEALLGCGPYFGTSCDLNGADLMWAEASAIVQTFVGSDSLGIAFADLGIANLVSAEFGTHLMDNGSGDREYRTDGRVMGSNGRLLRVDGDRSDPASRFLSLGSGGFVLNGNTNMAPSAVAAALSEPDYFPEDSEPCSLTAGRLLDRGAGSGGFNTDQQRALSRCWDLRDYYRAYGLQPGTAAFEVLGLGGPRCTTADIGGPLDPVAGVLPGCRNKWATIQYSPLSTWDGISPLHPNNPDAGYLGNNWFGQVLSYRAPLPFDPARVVSGVPDLNPRTDYRQWSSAPNAHVRGVTDLANAVGDCETGAAGDSGDPRNYDCYLNNPTDAGPSGLGTGATVRLDSAWGTGDVRYAAAEASRRSGLNWGVFVGAAAGAPCDPAGSASQMRDDPDCYLGGWRQTVDGDPDRMGLDPLSTNLVYPEYSIAYGAGLDYSILGFVNPPDYVNYGRRVEGGCTPGRAWIYLQRGADGQLVPPAECAEVFRNPSVSNQNTLPWGNALVGGAGHPFTGESFANELAGVSFNLLMLLVTFSSEFTDGLASVRGFVNPELYESRYIYDEEWMWNPECSPGGWLYDGDTAATVKSAEDCGGRHFVEALPGDQDYPADLNPRLVPYSAYGSPNRDPATLATGGRVRQLSGWRSMGVTAMKGDPAGFSRTDLQTRADQIPNPLPEGTLNALQRDPSLPNILTMYPDLLMRECTSARMAPDGSDLRQLYEACGTVANGGAADWTDNPATGNPWQEVRLGTLSGPGSGPDGGLLESLQWDYAFTGSENAFMAMIPYCEDISYTQRHVFSATADHNGSGSGNSGAAGALFGPNRIDCSRGLEGETLGNERCTYITPQYCGVVQALSGIAGQKRNVLRAGGNTNFGRRTMQWQSGSEIYLAYNQRNVLGFSMDFAEDVTKSNWSMEFTWIEGIPFSDSNSYDFVSDADDFNLTVSVDRPTFINFLNANRTFFFNSQWFFQYRKGYRDSFSAIGPWNVLATFAVFTGYFQDRLNPTAVFVYDFRSGSGGFLPQVNYRFSDRFSMTVGASVFFGEQKYVNMGVNTIGPASPRAGPHAYMDGSEPGLSIVRDRDEVFMTLRYTF